MNASAQQSLLIIDDHPVYRDALSEKLAQEFAEDGIHVAVASSATQGIERISNSTRQWVVLLDFLMPGLSGLAGIKVFKELRNVQHIVAISGLDEHTWEARTVAAGATMFLSKNSTADFIIRKIAPLLTRCSDTVEDSDTVEPKVFRLTQRQMEVLDLIAQGHPNKLIADYLDISEQTVKVHINQIFKELRVFNRTQAVLISQKHQLQLRDLH